MSAMALMPVLMRACREGGRGQDCASYDRGVAAAAVTSVSGRCN